MHVLERGRTQSIAEWFANLLRLDHITPPANAPANNPSAQPGTPEARKNPAIHTPPGEAPIHTESSDAASTTSVWKSAQEILPKSQSGAIPGTAGRLTPYLVILVDALLSFLFICTLRVAFRTAHNIKNSRNDAQINKTSPIKRMAILGAGDVGAALAADWLARPGLRRLPVVFLDDNEAKHSFRIHNIPVVGRIADLATVKQQYHIDEIVIAIGAPSPRRLSEVAALARENGLRAEIVPSLIELASGQARASRIRPVEIQDLLGRDQISLDNAAIGSLIRGKTVLVTGAGGSIGGELCRQIAARNPGCLLLVERCEVQLFKIEQALAETSLGGSVQPILGDITDEARMRHILSLHKPDIIFHAAAHKHVPLMERQPWEAIRNNTLGTRLLIELAVEYGVARFILISTDKAINPTSVMGATKRMAEIYLQARQTTIPAETPHPAPPAQAAAQGATPRETADGNPKTSDAATAPSPPVPRTRLMAVRFGNVLGSSGSVVPIFSRQIANGGPVRVTHPDVTRYFMTIPEAVGLVLQCAVLGKGGEIFVLNMGKPVKIAELARQMIELSNLRPDIDIAIEYTGLRPGEKLYEELRYTEEAHAPTTHADIMRFTPSHPDDLALITNSLSLFTSNIYGNSANDLKLAIKKIVPEYHPYLAE
ncbi:MAG: polysaccharide biosynthesis protein [Puniceicoccales bacterium]|nr:polysaccharide biosynthesis protein [Puniceicoccales bacterium]